VRVVTSRQRYDEPDAGLSEADSIRGVVVYRISTAGFGRTALMAPGFARELIEAAGKTRAESSSLHRA
jgi:hypothetical protein